VDNDCA